jgi:hypothetical protein
MAVSVLSLTSGAITIARTVRRCQGSSPSAAIFGQEDRVGRLERDKADFELAGVFFRKDNGGGSVLSIPVTISRFPGCKAAWGYVAVCRPIQIGTSTTQHRQLSNFFPYGCRLAIPIPQLGVNCRTWKQIGCNRPFCTRKYIYVVQNCTFVSKLSLLLIRNHLIYFRNQQNKPMKNLSISKNVWRSKDFGISIAPAR